MKNSNYLKTEILQADYNIALPIIQSVNSGKVQAENVWNFSEIRKEFIKNQKELINIYTNENRYLGIKNSEILFNEN